AGYAHEAGKGIIILVNKWDALKKDSHTMKEFEDNIRAQFQFLSYAPILFVSAKSKQRLDKIPDLIIQVHENFNRRIQSS
ncbi:ribosome biogenesis GTPase Der, partial [Actinotignum timonense]|nr:ribosome biogenesis GTPase Der [Actinotignum timonense]